MIPPKVNLHLIKEWNRAVELFNNKDYPFALFCSVSLIEEIGKISTLGICQFAEKWHHQNFDTEQPLKEKSNLRKELNKHRTKQQLAVEMTFLVNSRVARIYQTAEQRFARWITKDSLFKKRNNAIYIEYKNGVFHMPHERTSKDDSYLMVCMAGESLAEMQSEFVGSGPELHEEMIQKVDLFRTSHSEILEKIKHEESNKASERNAEIAPLTQHPSS